MMTKDELISIVKEQLAIEYNCSIDDFYKENNIITDYKYNERIRHYGKGEIFFQMVTLGKNAIISSNKSLHEWIKEYTKDKMGYHLFEYKNLVEIDKQLKMFDRKIKGTFHFFLSRQEIEPKNINIKTKIFEQDNIKQFYGKPLFDNNAIHNKFDPKRPDMLLIIGYDSDEIIGAAGCSADTPLLWQIGVDVDSNYRKKGIGTYLVQVLKQEIEKRNKIPFYGANPSNLYSWNIAINSGFFPVWIETST
jgi:GNAT superfamily N-acetyltransferase